MDAKPTPRNRSDMIISSQINAPPTQRHPCPPARRPPVAAAQPSPQTVHRLTPPVGSAPCGIRPSVSAPRISASLREIAPSSMSPGFQAPQASTAAQPTSRPTPEAPALPGAPLATSGVRTGKSGPVRACPGSPAGSLDSAASGSAPCPLPGFPGHAWPRDLAGASRKAPPSHAHVTSLDYSPNKSNTGGAGIIRQTTVRKGQIMALPEWPSWRYTGGFGGFPARPASPDSMTGCGGGAALAPVATAFCVARTGRFHVFVVPCPNNSLPGRTVVCVQS